VGRDTKRSSVRIIGGQWRSRRLEFPERDGLRPTPDRVRETVFNWLAPWIIGARCLDLFAGSGAFAFEALSRGAAHAVLVEREPEALAALHDNRERLHADAAEIVAGDGLDYLSRPVEPFDIVFLDPPYASGLLDSCLARLAERDWVRPGGFVYLEAPEGKAPVLPAGWILTRSKTAGQVGYHLAQRTTLEEAA
jgi:16S rRNA (guanine966-N2)-methyltransferase